MKKCLLTLWESNAWWCYALMSFLPLVIFAIAYLIYLPGWEYGAYAVLAIALTLATISVAVTLTKIIKLGIRRWPRIILAFVCYFAGFFIPCLLFRILFRAWVKANV